MSRRDQHGPRQHDAGLFCAGCGADWPCRPSQVQPLLPEGWVADNAGRCRGCAAPVVWCTTPAGKRSPVDMDGKSHFATCPNAAEWRRHDR